MAVCYQFLQQINDYIDNDIDQSELRLLEKHLAVCETCRLYVERSKTVKHSLTTLPKYKTSSSFDIVLRERLRNEIKQEKRLQFPSFSDLVPVRIPVMAAGAFAVIVMGIFISQALSVKETRQPVLAGQNVSGQETIMIPASASNESSEQSLKMRNYVNVREQFQLDAQYTRLLDSSDKQTGKIERQSADDSIRSVRPERNNKPLIRQANSTVHF